MSVSIASYRHPPQHNAMKVQIGGLQLYFSYETPIAFYHPSTGWVIRKNDWSKTTGSHLNLINPDKTIRIDGAEFERQLEKIT